LFGPELVDFPLPFDGAGGVVGGEVFELGDACGLGGDDIVEAGGVGGDP